MIAHNHIDFEDNYDRNCNFSAAAYGASLTGIKLQGFRTLQSYEITVELDFTNSNLVDVNIVDVLIQLVVYMEQQSQIPCSIFKFF